MAVRRIDDGFDDFGRRIGLADAFQTGIRAHADEHDILATGGLLLDRFNSQDLADDFLYFHAISRAGSSGLTRCVERLISPYSNVGKPRSGTFYGRSCLQKS